MTITRSTVEEKPAKTTLLTLARAAAKEQWSTGESQWIWGDAKVGGAYLKNVNGFVRLYLTRQNTPGLNIYMLRAEGWGEVRDLDQKYEDWKREVDRRQVEATNHMTRWEKLRIMKGAQ